MIKDNTGKMEVRKKNLAENFQVSHERMMELEFKAIKYMGLEERLQMTKKGKSMYAQIFIKNREISNKLYGKGIRNMK